MQILAAKEGKQTSKSVIDLNTALCWLNDDACGATLCGKQVDWSTPVHLLVVIMVTLRREEKKKKPAFSSAPSCT